MEDKVREIVCVTGAGGYQASWLVKLLLSLGYKVHGTVRDPSDKKNAHLMELPNASENLRLFKADLLDLQGLCAAISGCTGVFHVACPIPMTNLLNPQVEMIEPAVTGTANVLKACSKAAQVKKVVLVSSIAAVYRNPNWPKDQLMDETCWTDKQFCKTNDSWFNWYSLAKTEAESLAFQYANDNGLDVVSVCPSAIIGPMLQPTLNASSLLLLNISNGGLERRGNDVWNVVDVRDVAEALLLAYKKPEAHGRYICSSYAVSTHELVNKLKIFYPNHNYPKQISNEEIISCKLSSEKLHMLGWNHRPLEETLVDSIENYYEKGHLMKKV